MYHLLGIDVDAPTDESFLTYYSTEYLIWANDAAKEKLGVDFAGEGPMISPCFLMNQLFDLCGWQGPSYMKFSRTIQAMTPVMTTNNRFLEKGELVSRLALSDEAWQGVRTMRIVQFYLMRDSGGALPVAEASIRLDLPVCLAEIVIAVIPTLIFRKFHRLQGILMVALYCAYLTVSVIGG